MSKTPAKPFPTLLSKSDAMMYASKQLEDMIGHMRLTKIMHEALGKIDLSKEPPAAPGQPSTAELMEELRVSASGIVDVDLQEKAMRQAVEEIRSLAHEQKLVEARAAAHGIHN